MSQSDKASSVGGFPWKELLVLFGVLISAYFGYLQVHSQVEIPIHATETAEVRLTEFVNFYNMTQSAILPSVTWTPSPLVTETPASITTATTSNAAPEVLLQDDFTANRNGWLIQFEQGIRSNIVGGKYRHIITCPPEYEAYYCGYDLQVPEISAKDVRLEVDVTIRDLSPAAEVMISFQIRRNAGNFYAIFFRNTGKYTIDIVYNSLHERLLDVTSIPGFDFNSEVNRYGFSIQGNLLFPLFNGRELPSVEDGNINQAGLIYIVFYVSRGASATIELDNLIITNLSGN